MPFKFRFKSFNFDVTWGSGERRDKVQVESDGKERELAGGGQGEGRRDDKGEKGS